MSNVNAPLLIGPIVPVAGQSRYGTLRVKISLYLSIKPIRITYYKRSVVITVVTLVAFLWGTQSTRLPTEAKEIAIRPSVRLSQCPSILVFTLSFEPWNSCLCIDCYWSSPYVAWNLKSRSRVSVRIRVRVE